MNPGVPVAFLQLMKQPRRLLIAVAGIAMSSLGILGQMGFEDSLFRSATRLFQELDADIALLSPQYQFMGLPAQFGERRLYQALSVPGVKSFSSVRLGGAPFKNPVTRANRNVYVVGVGRAGDGVVLRMKAGSERPALCGSRTRSCSTRARVRSLVPSLRCSAKARCTPRSPINAFASSSCSRWALLSALTAQRLPPKKVSSGCFQRGARGWSISG